MGSRENNKTTGIYSAEGSSFYDYNSNSCPDFDTYISGFIDIQHLDTEENIISGYFEIILDNGCGEILEITEGVFDTGYHL